MFRLATCVVITAAAGLLGVLVSVHGTPIVFLAFIPTLFACTWLAGGRGGFLSLALSVVGVVYVLPPFGHFYFHHTFGAYGALVMYLASGAMIIRATSRLKDGITDRDRLLAEARDRQRLIEDITEAAPAGIVILDGQSLRVRYANAAYQEFLDEPHRQGGIVGLTLEEFLPGARESGLIATYQELARTGRQHVDLEYEHVGFARGTTWWRWATLPMPGKGPPFDLMVMLVEVTEQVRARRRAEEAAHQAEGHLRELQAVIDSMLEGVVIADPEGKLLLRNRTAARLLGFASSTEDGSAPAAPPLMPEPGQIEFMTPDGSLLPRDQRPLWRVARGETFEEFELQLRLARTDRALMTSWSGTAVRGPSGEPMLLVLTIRDVTEARALQAERQRLLVQVQSQAAELEAVLSSVAIALMLFKRDGRIARANAAARTLLGYTDQDLGSGLTMDAGAARHRFEGEDGKPIPVEALPAHQALRGVTSHGVVLGLPTPDEGRLWFSCSAAPVRGPDGAIVGAVSTMADITRRREIEAELRATAAALADADRRKGEFLAILGHELRNPLAAISAAVHLLERTGSPEASTTRLHAVISRQTARMARLMDDLLDVSRIELGHLELRRTRLDAREVVRAAIETSRPAIEARRHELHVALAGSPLPLDGDPVRLEQVVCNLLDNAAKYTPSGGQIWVSAERQSEQVVLRVKDTGVGISAESLPKIFGLFVRAEGAWCSQEGLGIGLGLARQLVRMHEGTIEARSGGGGQGSEFVVRLPALPAEVSPTPARPAGETQRPTVEGHVLVVDDNHDLAEALATAVELWGFRVQVARDGRTAMAMALADPPDVALLDIGLPDLDGYEVARQLRELLPRERHTQLVALTGFGQTEDRQRAEEAGFQLHLTKPVDMTTLRRVLQVYCH